MWKRRRHWLKRIREATATTNRSRKVKNENTVGSQIANTGLERSLITETTKAGMEMAPMAIPSISALVAIVAKGLRKDRRNVSLRKGNSATIELVRRNRPIVEVQISNGDDVRGHLPKEVWPHRRKSIAIGTDRYRKKANGIIGVIRSIGDIDTTIEAIAAMTRGRNRRKRRSIRRNARNIPAAKTRKKRRNVSLRATSTLFKNFGNA